MRAGRRGKRIAACFMGGGTLALAACGPMALGIRAVTADVGRGPLVVLVGGDQEQARTWLDAATPGYRFVHVDAGGDRGALRPGGPRILIVPGRYQSLGLELAQRDSAAVAGVLIVDDGTALSPAWQEAIRAHGWRWTRIAASGPTAQARTQWQAWLPPRQAAFSIQPSPRPDGWPGTGAGG